MIRNAAGFAEPVAFVASAQIVVVRNCAYPVFPNNHDQEGQVCKVSGHGFRGQRGRLVPRRRGLGNGSLPL